MLKDSGRGDYLVSLDGDYNYGVVLLSFIIAVCAAYSALNFVYKIARSQGRIKLGWIFGAAFVMGSGIWTMHFVGMMAFHIGMVVSYDIPITVISIAASVLTSFLAFYLTLSNQASKARLISGGLVMGAGIVVMHYTGMASMESQGLSITYNSYIWALSAVIAVVASCVALYLFHRFSNNNKHASIAKWATSVLLGLAVCGMHYTGMSAASFWCGDPSLLSEETPINLALLVGVTVMILLIMMVTWFAVYFDRNVLEKMAYSDPLTGLSNRHAMNRYFNDNISEARQEVFFFIDLDQFKIINDTLGHDIGDMLVKDAASRLQSHLRAGTEAFRLGGDEFLLIASGLNQDQAEQLAQKLLEDIRRPYLLEGNELYITGSIGISLSPQHGTKRATLLTKADTAMYQAKRLGKNQYCLYNEELDKKIVRRMQLEKDLRIALAREQFVIHYQPKWNASMNRPYGVEALSRWQHPELGLIAPDEFIPIAEETGLIVPMTRWVLGQACLDCMAWNEQEQTPLSVSVNLSVKVFDSQNLLDMVTKSLELVGMDPSLLELEITETIIMNNVENVIQQLIPLKEMGVIISMDDFGSGYSSLGSIDRIPFHTLKIDKQYMEQSASPSKRAIVNTIIGLAKELSLGIVAEGVETEQQIEFLKSAGCNLMQGYYFSKPMPREELDQWLAQLQQSRLASVSSG